MNKRLRWTRSYALGHVLLAAYYWLTALVGYHASKHCIAQGKSAVLEALKLDDTLAEAHSMFGLLLGMCDFDWIGAEREYQRALELNPASADVHFFAY